MLYKSLMVGKSDAALVHHLSSCGYINVSMQKLACA
jgi:hypothetical protein